MGPTPNLVLCYKVKINDWDPDDGLLCHKGREGGRGRELESKTTKLYYY